MKAYTKLRLGGITLLVIPPLVLTGDIIYQLSQMNPPTAGQLNLRWAFVAFYAMSAGLVLLIFARGIKARDRLKSRK